MFNSFGGWILYGITTLQMLMIDDVDRDILYG